ncbi:MAG: threonine synthase [Elusimicrobia bacterium]|nr:threonine synthase [Elusimicrobiota bacterium]
MRSGIIEKYRNHLPVSEKTPLITLQEGDTPLVPAPHLARAIGLDKKHRLYLKLEGMNPTGSFKDRGMTLAISKAVEEGAKAVVCASTGNTSASAAAYAARAGMACYVFLPHGSVALGKLTQALMHGAKVFTVRGNFDQALNLVRKLSEKYGWTMVNSTNPYRLEGQKTAAFEIVEVLEAPPHFQFMPVGNAGNITAYWRGYKELQFKVPASPAGRQGPKSKVSEEKNLDLGHGTSDIGPRLLPRMMGFQAEGSAPIVLGKPIKNPKTIATAIRIGNPVSWKEALQARDESGGLIGSVSDKEILSAYTLVAQTEGVFCEPSSAAGIAGLIKLAHSGYFRNPQSAIRDSKLRIVCILTGHGLKDPDQPLKVSPKLKVVSPNLKDIEKAIR